MAGEIKINDVSIATESGGTVTLGNATLGSTVVLGTNASPIASNLVLAAGNGIDFSAASGSAAGSSSAVLDDYEEGTFTPYWYSDIGGEWLGKTTNSGFYTKVGRLIHIFGTATYSSKAAGATSTLRIRGFPFIANPNNPGVPDVGWENVIPDSGDYKVRFANTDLLFYAAGSLQGGSSLIGIMPASGTYQFNFCIIV